MDLSWGPRWPGDARGSHPASATSGGLDISAAASTSTQRRGPAGRGLRRLDLRRGALRLLAGSAGLTLVLAVVTVAVQATSDPSALPMLTTIVRIVSACLCVLAGVLRLSLHDLTGDRDSTVLGVGLLLVGGTLLPSSVILSLLASSISGIEPVVRTIETLILLALLAAFVDHRGQLSRSPKEVLRVVGPAVILGGAAATAVVALAAAQLGALVPTAWTPFAGLVPTAAWTFVAVSMSVRPWSPGGREALALAWVLALGCALRVAGYAGHPELVLVAAMVTLVAAITAAARAMHDLDGASSASRHEAAARATLLADTRLDLTEEAAKGSALRHDALNSLAALRAAMECLQTSGSGLDPRSDHLVTAALGEVGHLEHLLTRKGQADPVSFGVDDVVAGIIESRRPTGLHVDFDASRQLAWGVPGDFATVLQNLLVNAHIHGGGREVSVRCCGDMGFVEVRVRDSGPGIPDHVRPTIFEPGVRASTRPGAGLGLHIARQLMREQGGDVWLECTRRGAEFVIRIPRARVEQLQ